MAIKKVILLFKKRMWKKSMFNAADLSEQNTIKYAHLPAVPRTF
jgi:hypothetical protein